MASGNSPYSLTGYSYDKPPADFFGVTPASQLAQSFDLQLAQVLAVDATSRAASDRFGVSSGIDLYRDIHSKPPASITDFLKQEEPKASKSVGALSIDIAADITHLHKVKEAAEAGKILYESSKEIHESAAHPMEATVCQAAKVTAEKAFDITGKSIVVGGIPFLAAEIIANPVSILAVPLVAEVLPQAYANVEAFSKFAGEKAEADCHLLFTGTK